MRKDEFIKAAGSYNRRAFALVIIPVLLAFACIVAYSPFKPRFEAYVDSRTGGPPPEILKTLPMAVPVVLAFAAMIPLGRRNDRDLGVPCPHCGKPLAGFKAIVIASKNCPYCGKKVIDDIL